jgi:hypothetical protein
MAAAAFVGFTVLPERNIRSAPISFSSERICCATPAGVRLRRRAASAIDPQSTTAMKLSRKRVSISIKCIFRRYDF